MRLTDSRIGQQLSREGYVYLERFRPDISTLQVAGELGEILKTPDTPLVQRIVPKQQAQAATNLYSGNFGLKEFPFHTDLAHWYIPPRYFILRCVISAPRVFTALEDFPAVLAGIPQDTILRALFLPRRKLIGKRHLLRLLQQLDGNQLLRWDSHFIVPANSEAEEVSNHLASLEVGTASKKITFTYSGDTLVVDNWRMLHGKSSVPFNGMMRVIERVYLREIN